MALAPLTPFSVLVRACGGGFADAAQPVRPKLQLAVGFDAGSAWISAQCGELAIRKHTRLEPHETTIALQREADMVSVIVGVDAVAVARSTTRIAVDCDEALVALHRLLAGSSAVCAALGIRAELEEATNVCGPETSLLSSMEFLAALVRHGRAANRVRQRCADTHAGMTRRDGWFGSNNSGRHSDVGWDALRAEWTRFRTAELTWLRGLGSIGPFQPATFPSASKHRRARVSCIRRDRVPHTLDRPRRARPAGPVLAGVASV